MSSKIDDTLHARVRRLVNAKDRKAAYDLLKTANAGLDAEAREGRHDPVAWEDLADGFAVLGEVGTAVTILDGLAARSNGDSRLSLKAIAVMAAGYRRPLTGDATGFALIVRRLSVELARLKTKDARTLTELATVYFQLERVGLANDARHYRTLRYRAEDELLRLDPGSLETWLQRARNTFSSRNDVPVDRKRRGEAIARALQAIGEPAPIKLPQYAEIYDLCRGGLLLDRQIELASICVTLKPGVSPYMLDLVRYGRRYPQLVTPSELDALADALLASNDPKAAYWHSAAAALIDGGRLEMGLTAIERCLAIEPDHRAANALRAGELAARSLGL
jgi:tetratricopeptide (TPR) repeat protein